MTTSRDILAEAEAHRRAGRLAEAEHCYRQALGADPASAQAHNQLGIALAQQGKVDEAIACFRQALSISPNSREVFRNLQTAMADKNYAQGLSALDAGRYDDAGAWFRNAIARRPDYAEAHNNLGVALQLVGKPDEAEASLRRAVQLKPDYADAYSNLGGVLELQGTLSADSVNRSLASFRRAVELQPDRAEFHLNLALSLLRTGNFAEGWREFEWRSRREGRGRRFSQPRWAGEPLEGKTILLWEEEGFGDSLQCIRYAELLKLRGARVIVECRRDLARLLATCPGVGEVLVAGAPAQFDVEAPLLSLPGLLQTNLATIPAKVPYLFPDAALVEEWKERLRERGRLKVGLVWQGNRAQASDRFRSIPPAHFAGLAGSGDVRFYSIQTGAGREQLADVQSHLAITDLADQIADWQDTAAIMRNLDLVITCDSAPAHLAGALGVPVWVALAYVPDWRWLLERTDSPWYPTMRLYRQSRPGDWQEVFERIAADLAVTVAEHGESEVAIGDSPQAPATGRSSGKPGGDHETAPVETNYSLGLACLRSGRYDDAAAHFRQAIECRPDHAEAHNNLGAILLRTVPDEAEVSLRRAVQLRPDYALAHNNLGAVLEMQGELSAESVERSLASFRRAVELQPDSAEMHHNYGMALLRTGNFAEGWREFEWRRRRHGLDERQFSQPRWSGGPLEGKTILLWEDEGQGDSLQCVRYAERLGGRGARVIVECRGALASLLANCPGVDEVLVAGAPLPAFDLQLPLLSLPGVVGTVLDTIPTKVPYLFPQDALVKKWEKELCAVRGLRIGIAWQGNPRYALDRFRSIPLESFAPLGAVADVHFYSLQVGADREQLNGSTSPLPITDLADGIADFQDTAAIMRNLDLVITCDSAPAHLAGALGASVWVALAYVPDWRWLLERTDSPWYPTMRLYRQARPGDWQEVFERIAADLAAKVRTEQ